MMIGKIIGLLGICAATLFAQKVVASVYLGCDSCTAAQMMQTAQAAGVGRFIVGDVINKQAAAYIVKAVQHGSADPTFVAGLDVLSAQETGAFNSMVAFYNDAPVGYQKTFNLIIDPSSSSGSGAVSTIQRPTTMSVPVGGIGHHIEYPYGDLSAFTVIDQSPTQNQFLKWCSTLPQFGIDQAMSDLGSVLGVLHVFDMSHVPGISYTVTFTDGSSIGVYVDTTQQPPQITINTSTAVDSHGNIIPVNQAAIAGTGRKIYNYGASGASSDISNMRTRLGYFGVDAPMTVQYACVWVEGIGTHCSPYAGPGS